MKKYRLNLLSSIFHPIGGQYGRRWSIAPSVNPGGYDFLRSVVAVSANDVWAAGSYIPYGKAFSQTLIEHWDGTSWSVVKSPNAGFFATLDGMVATSRSDVWAVGSYGRHQYDDPTLIEHWDGASWSIVPSPNGGSYTVNNLYSASAVSANDIWVVGEYIPSNSVYFQTLIEHWDGTNWSIAPSPNVPNTLTNSLAGVVAISASDVRAVGTYESLDYRDHPLIEGWDGANWSIVPSPDPGIGSSLNGIAAISANDVWAVGVGGNGAQPLTLTEHWDGTSWSVIPSPNIRNDSGNWLEGVARIPTTRQLWAVGDYSPAWPTYYTLTEVY